MVAAEVRNLAQRSSAAAKEIKILIDDSVDKVEAGTKLVSNAGTTMDDVVVGVKQVTDIVAEISAASNEQSIGIDKVGAAIGQMDRMTQQNVALVEEAAAAAGSMQHQADNLARTVAVFQIGAPHVRAENLPRADKVTSHRTRPEAVVFTAPAVQTRHTAALVGKA